MSFKYSHFGIETDSILFLPKIEKDSSWLSPINEVFTNYNFLKFTCDSVYYDTIIGNITDSIKLISIQAYNGSSPINSGFDTVQLLLSKHYGFIQFISFYKGNYQIPIIGIDSNTTKAGFQLATFSDYFHLNVGDVIIWKEHYSSFNPMNQSYTSFIKDSITNVISSSDSVIYSSTRTYSGQSIIHPSTLKHYKNKLGGLTLSTNKPISILSINFWGTNIFNDLETYKTSSIYKTSNSANNRSYIWEGNTHDTSTCSTGYFTDAGYDVQYNTYYGLTSFNLYSYDDTYSWTIEGSVINGVQIGNVWNVGLNENNSDKNELNIFPNPTNNYITVDGKDLKIIELINIQGLVVIRLNDIKNKETIDLQDLPKGIYLIKVLFNNGTIATEKVLIN
jgi:hypothetical protein